MAIKTIESGNSNEFLLIKYPDREITIGSQIIVNESEDALIFENGQLLQILKPGRHLIESGNIPGIEKLIKSSFGNKSPIVLDIFFINKIVKFDLKWGTQIQFQDSKYDLIFPLGGYGSYATRAKDGGSMVIQLLGKESSLSQSQLRNKLNPLIEREIKDRIAETIDNENINIFTISTRLKEISNDVKNSLINEFSRFGLELVDFYVQGLDVIGDDPTLESLRESLSKAADLKLRARAASEAQGFYQVERSLDALNKAAENEAGLPGTFLAGGVGLGLGANAGQQMGKAMSENTFLGNNQKDSLQQNTQSLSDKFKELKQLLDMDMITKEDYDIKKKELLDDL